MTSINQVSNLHNFASQADSLSLGQEPPKKRQKTFVDPILINPFLVSVEQLLARPKTKDLRGTLSKSSLMALEGKRKTFTFSRQPLKGDGISAEKVRPQLPNLTRESDMSHMPMHREAANVMTNQFQELDEHLANLNEKVCLGAAPDRLVAERDSVMTGLNDSLIGTDDRGIDDALPESSDALLKLEKERGALQSPFLDPVQLDVFPIFPSVCEEMTKIARSMRVAENDFASRDLSDLCILMDDRVIDDPWREMNSALFALEAEMSVLNNTASDPLPLDALSTDSSFYEEMDEIARSMRVAESNCASRDLSDLCVLVDDGVIDDPWRETDSTLFALEAEMNLFIDTALDSVE